MGLEEDRQQVAIIVANARKELEKVEAWYRDLGGEVESPADPEQEALVTELRDRAEKAEQRAEELQRTCDEVEHERNRLAVEIDKLKAEDVAKTDAQKDSEAPKPAPKKAAPKRSTAAKKKS